MQPSFLIPSTDVVFSFNTKAINISFGMLVFFTRLFLATFSHSQLKAVSYNFGW